MKTWVYLFSKFTPEILYSIGLILCFLGCGYTAFWVLRKRRYGAVDAWVPSGPIRNHLNQLISDAQNLRIQLFGLLTEVDLSSHQDSSQALIQLEAKLAEQTKLVHQITQEKAQLERKLLNATAATPTSSTQKPSPSAPPVTQLRAPTAAVAAVAPLQPSPPATIATVLPLTAVATAPSTTAAPPTNTAAPPPAAHETSSATVSTAHEAPASPELAPTTPSPVTATGTPTDGTQNTAPALEPNEKSEADLVAEFEKILKG
jgi:hypothetical protein